MSINRLPEHWILPCFQQVETSCPRSNRKTSNWSAVNFKKTLYLDELLTWARDMVTWYWSADTLFWQVSVNQGCMSHCQPVIWSIAAMLRDSVVVVRTRPRAIPLAMRTMRKSIHGFPFVSHIWDAYGALLGGPLGRRSSAITKAQQAFLFVFHEGRQSLFSRS